MSGNFGYMGRSNPRGHLDQMWHVGRYGGRNHVCNIWWLSVKGRGCGERGSFAFYWLEVSPLQHWSHNRVTVWYCKSRQRSFVRFLVLCLAVHRTLLCVSLHCCSRCVVVLRWASKLWTVTTLGHASVEWVMARQLTPVTVLRDRKQK